VHANLRGYDITRLVAVCLERLEQQARHERYPQHTAIPAGFESAIMGLADEGKNDNK